MLSPERRRIAIIGAIILGGLVLAVLTYVFLPAFSPTVRLSRLQEDIAGRKINANQADQELLETFRGLSDLARAFVQEKGVLKPPKDGLGRLNELDRRLKALEKKKPVPAIVGELRGDYRALREIFSTLEERQQKEKQPKKAGKPEASSQNWLLLAFGAESLLVTAASLWVAWRALKKVRDVNASLNLRLRQAEDRINQRILTTIQEAKKGVELDFDRLEVKITGIEEAVRRLQQRGSVELRPSGFTNKPEASLDDFRSEWGRAATSRLPARQETPGNFIGKVSDLSSLVPSSADEMEFDPVSDMLAVPKGRKQTPGYRVFADRSGEIRVVPAVEKAMSPSEIYWMQPLFDIENVGAGSLNVLRHPSLERSESGYRVIAKGLLRIG